MHKILINALGTENSGGIAVLRKTIQEVSLDEESQYYVLVYSGKYIDNLMIETNYYNNIHFKIMSNHGLIYRVFFENILMPYCIKKNNISLIYNLTGTSQFFTRVPQITKVQNLLFFSKKLDSVYIRRGLYLLWIKQIFIKRMIIQFMLNKSNFIEIQSEHVKSNLSDFIVTRDKSFYVKSDIDISEFQFQAPKRYDFSKKIKFLYIVGPHFEYVHKNIIDFINAMLDLEKKKINFEINITLTSDQLRSYKGWNSSLNAKTNFFGYISDNLTMAKLFCDNTILISTSIIETLGLHVIEGIKNGVVTIAPDAYYTNAVYGKNMIMYELFNNNSMSSTIMSVINYEFSHSDRILSLQNDLKKSELSKYRNIVDIFEEVINV